MCEPGYLETEIFDDAGSPHLVCLKAFCGIKGYGTTCSEIPTTTAVKNCLQISRVQFSAKTTLDSCDQCKPGYYAYTYAFKALADGGLAFVRNCAQQSGTITKNFFIQPENVAFFASEHDKTMYGTQLLGDKPGARFDNPLYFIQQAFTLLQDFQKVAMAAYQRAAALLPAEDLDQRVVNPYDKYENVTANIWLYKGVHHFVQCPEHLKWKHAEATDANDPWGGGLTEDADLKAFTTLCKTDNTFFPLRNVNNNERYDNKLYYVRPLECKLRDTLFQKMETWGPEADFDRYCVDFERGDAKP